MVSATSPPVYDASATRKAIIEYVRRQYQGGRGGVPSVASILDHFNWNTARFYEEFPGRLAEVCREAGVPLPEDRIESTRRAVEAHSDRARSAGSPKWPEIALPEELKRKLHVKALQFGMDPEPALREAVTWWIYLKGSNLTAENIPMIGSFLTSAYARGWSNQGLLVTMEALLRCDFHTLTPTQGKRLFELVGWLQKIRMRSHTFVAYVLMHGDTIGPFMSFVEGNLSLDKMTEAILKVKRDDGRHYKWEGNG